MWYFFVSFDQHFTVNLISITNVHMPHLIETIWEFVLYCIDYYRGQGEGCKKRMIIEEIERWIDRYIDGT